MQLLQKAADALPFIQELQSDDCFVALADQTKFLSYLPGTHLDLGIQPGTPFRKGGVNETVLQEGRKVTQYVEEEAYGTSYVVTGIPLQENGKTLGCLTMGVLPDAALDGSCKHTALLQAVIRISAQAEKLLSGCSDTAVAADKTNNKTSIASYQLQQMKETAACLHEPAPASQIREEVSAASLLNEQLASLTLQLHAAKEAASITVQHSRSQQETLHQIYRLAEEIQALQTK
ncbi:hypothetical protein [Alkalicoccus daliensis]|uniref:Uncharacterized protein n=1 Tax=Alkalicoccus daliensis TaxID=745820 RepID=A0A1H0JKU2_9BACI|nr:hypothetical protein [Alkalicoccus daliensis]SDO44398.1 hypothetical protein SAMN04488053_1146 [Alkalicoccus daliensis]